MFTWEEAGLLRQMIHVVVWTLVCAAVTTLLIIEREPIASGARSAYHALHDEIQVLTHRNPSG